MKKYFKENYKLILIKLLIIVAVLSLDIVTKIVFANVFSARYNANNYDNIVVIKDVLSFTYTENVGAAFSIFSGQIVFLIVFSLIFIGVFIVIDILYKEKNWWFVIGYTFILGGALGNLIDRIFLGYVRDFISFDFLKNFAICNMADVFITIGCCLIVVYFIQLLAKGSKEKPKQVKFDNEQVDDDLKSKKENTTEEGKG